MKMNDKIKDEKLQYDINREAGKISALLSGKIEKHEYLTGEEILSSDQSRIIEQTRCTYSPLDKEFEKQIKAIDEQGKQLVKSNDEKESLIHSKQNEIFKELNNGRMEEI